MSWVAVAVVGGAAIGAVASSSSASKSARASRDAADSQARSADKALAFDYERYDDWQTTYGGLQENLSDYYSNVTPEYYASVGLENFELENSAKMKNIEELFAQRGIDPNSGLAVSIEAQAELDAAESRASIRRDAPRAAAEDQSRFLQIGLGQNPASSVSQSMANQTAVAGQHAAAAQQQALYDQRAVSESYTAVGKSIGTAIDTYQRRPQTPVVQPGISGSYPNQPMEV